MRSNICRYVWRPFHATSLFQNVSVWHIWKNILSVVWVSESILLLLTVLLATVCTSISVSSLFLSLSLNFVTIYNNIFKQNFCNNILWQNFVTKQNFVTIFRNQWAQWQLNKKHKFCLTNFRILLIISHVCKWWNSQRL